MTRAVEEEVVSYSLIVKREVKVVKIVNKLIVGKVKS